MIFASQEESQAAVDAAVRVLSEHFEAVQVLCSRVAPDCDGTQRYFAGAGNWYARQGMAKEYCDQGQGTAYAGEIAKVLPAPRPPDDGEDWKTENPPN